MKEIIEQKEVKSVNAFINLFSDINPTYAKLFSNKTQRSASERLLKLHDVVWWGAFIQGYKTCIEEQYCPKATTPLQLENKFANIYYYAKGREKKAVTVVKL